MTREEALARLPYATGLETLPVGPGTHFRRILSILGVQKRGGCNCQGMEAQMNRLGAAGCRTQMQFLVGKLVDEAEARGWSSLLPKRWGAAALIKLAIRQSVKSAQNHAKG